MCFENLSKNLSLARSTVTVIDNIFDIYCFASTENYFSKRLIL